MGLKLTPAIRTPFWFFYFLETAQVYLFDACFAFFSEFVSRVLVANAASFLLVVLPGAVLIKPGFVFAPRFTHIAIAVTVLVDNEGNIVLA